MWDVQSRASRYHCPSVIQEVRRWVGRVARSNPTGGGSTLRPCASFLRGWNGPPLGPLCPIRCLPQKASTIGQLDSQDPSFGKKIGSYLGAHPTMSEPSSLTRLLTYGICVIDPVRLAYLA